MTTVLRWENACLTLYSTDYLEYIKGILLRGAEEACWAHNPKVLGSKPSGANCFAEFQHSKPNVPYICRIRTHVAGSGSNLFSRFHKPNILSREWESIIGT